MNILGDSLEKIAREKAGIIKEHIPVVVGEHEEATAIVFEKEAEEHHAPLSFASSKYTVFDWKFEKHQLVAEVTRLHTDQKNIYHLDLTGLYQVKNLITVLEAVHTLYHKGWKITDYHVQKALGQVKKLTGLHGRWETIHEHPRVILDVAHNEDGIHQLVAQLELTTYHRLRIVIGMVKDKEVDKVLSLLPPHAIYYFTRAQIPRALPEHQVAEKAAVFGLKGSAYPEVNDALKAAMAQASNDDLILVCGSVFIVGELDQRSLQGK
jgi:dihydrofolate synthase/folylpolyglutamate synthase